jgi:basic membrane protein A and related proteins
MSIRYLGISVASVWQRIRLWPDPSHILSALTTEQCSGKGNTLRSKPGKGLISAVMIGGLVLSMASCGSAPAKKPTAAASASVKAFRGCMVTDTGGIDDKSFNAAAWAGLQAAQKQNPAISPKYTQSNAQADYAPNLTNFAQQKCDLIVAVGGLMGPDLDKVAKANPTEHFAIVDYKAAETNAYSMQFDTAQAAYLGGYLAAGMSKTGVVGTYGGAAIAPVEIYMDGFAEGVAQYNTVHHTSVVVRGWDITKQTGLFAKGFDDQAGGKTLAATLVGQGADIIMPVAGGTGLGTAAAAQTSGGKFNVIWVDQDGCIAAAQYCNVFVSSVEKNIATEVQESTIKAAAGTLSGGSIGTLANNGVALAPYHDFATKVPATLQAEITSLKADIISGKIVVTSKSSPK